MCMSRCTKEPSGPAWEAYKIALGTRGALDMIVWLHADAPKYVVDELTQAFRDMSQDPEYQRALLAAIPSSSDKKS